MVAYVCEQGVYRTETQRAGSKSGEIEEEKKAVARGGELRSKKGRWDAKFDDGGGMVGLMTLCLFERRRRGEGEGQRRRMDTVIGWQLQQLALPSTVLLAAVFCHRAVCVLAVSDVYSVQQCPRCCCIPLFFPPARLPRSSSGSSPGSS